MHRCDLKGLYVLVGPVASGKSTIREAIYSYFKSHGVLYVTFAYKTILVPLVNIFSAIFGKKGIYAYYKIINILLCLDIVVWTIISLLTVILNRFAAITVEDHIVGALHDYIYIYEVYLNRKMPRWVIYILLILIRFTRPKGIIYLYVSPAESRKRQVKRGDKRIEYESYLLSQYSLLPYLVRLAHLVSGTKIIIIDSTRERPTVLINNIVNQICNRRDQI